MKRVSLLIWAMVPIFSFSQWTLVWSDEFNGTSLDENKWVAEIGTGTWGWGNNELQYYTDRNENISISNGMLNIVAIKESYNGSSYTSARIKTQGKFDVKYGKIEARIKVPVDQGLWPAFWMLGSNITSIGWPSCGEIDIMEHVNHELQIHGTIHFDMWGHTYVGEKAFTDASEFHVYAIEWDASEIRWYLDGNQFHQEPIDASTVSREEFHEPFFMLLNLAVGGNWPGSPNTNTQFPATYSIDYVRVYQEGLSVKEMPLADLEIYPNPATNTLSLRTDVHLLEVQFYEITGKMVKHCGPENEINLEGLAPGVYHVIVSDIHGNSIQKKLIIQ